MRVPSEVNSFQSPAAHKGGCYAGGRRGVQRLQSFNPQPPTKAAATRPGRLAAEQGENWFQSPAAHKGGCYLATAVHLLMVASSQLVSIPSRPQRRLLPSCDRGPPGVLAAWAFNPQPPTKAAATAARPVPGFGAAGRRFNPQPPTKAAATGRVLRRVGRAAREAVSISSAAHKGGYSPRPDAGGSGHRQVSIPSRPQRRLLRLKSWLGSGGARHLLALV